MTVLDSPAPRTGRKARGDGHLRRAEILEAAERIFVRDGYEGATIRKIAEEVGVSSTALYLHFRDKAHILLEIAETAFERLLAANAAIESEPLDPAERVRRMLEAYIDFALENPKAYWLVFSSPPREATVPEEAAAKAHDLGQRCFARFEGALGELAAAGRLATPPDIAAQTLWAAGHGLASLLTTRTRFPWADVAVLRTTLLNGVLRGLLRD